LVQNYLVRGDRSSSWLTSDLLSYSSTRYLWLKKGYSCNTPSEKTVDHQSMD
jgi:hypothetical protein